MPRLPPSSTAMGKGEVELLLLGPGSQSGLHAARRAEGSRRHPEGPDGGQLRQSARRDGGPRPPDPPRHALARVVGRLRAARGRPRASYSPRCPRSATRGRWATSCSRSARAALGAEEGKGPLSWGTVGQYVRETWEAALPGQWPAALQQGGAWRDVPAVPVDAQGRGGRGRRRQARGRWRLASPSGRFPRSGLYDGRERGQFLAPGDPRHHDPVGLGRLGRDSGRGRREARHRRG